MYLLGKDLVINVTLKCLPQKIETVRQVWSVVKIHFLEETETEKITWVSKKN